MRDLGVFRVVVNEKGGLFVPREAPRVYFIGFLWVGVFRVEVNKKGGLFVP